MKKKTFTEIIKALEELTADCICDAKSDWIERSERFDLTIDINVLNNVIGNLKRIAENPKSQVFNNITLKEKGDKNG